MPLEKKMLEMRIAFHMMILKKRNIFMLKRVVRKLVIQYESEDDVALGIQKANETNVNIFMRILSWIKW